MKYVFFLLLCLSLNAYGQEFQPIKGRQFSGYIVKKEYPVFKNTKDQRYTPSENDIKRAESILLSNEKYINQHQINEGFGSEDIYKSLYQYIRQYVGFVNKSGDHIVWVNMLHEKGTTTAQAARHIIWVRDGGNYYWSVYINITKWRLYNMMVEESA